MYGGRIKYFRESANLTQEHVAEKLGITQGAYSQIENNQSKLSADMLKKVAAILGVSPLDILNTQPTIVNFDSTIHGQGVGQIENFYTFQREFVEKIVASKDEQIAALQNTINTLQATIESLIKNKG